MDLNYTPEDIAYRKQVRAWLEQNLPKTEIGTLEERRVWHRKLYEAGYLGMGWPKEYGGAGARPMEQAIVADELARSNAPAPTNSLGIGIVGPTIVVHGTDDWLIPVSHARRLHAAAGEPKRTPTSSRIRKAPSCRLPTASRSIS